MKILNIKTLLTNYINKLKKKIIKLNYHQNDLNELNSLIIDLKSKIAELQEENDNLCLSQRSLKDKI